MLLNVNAKTNPNTSQWEIADSVAETHMQRLHFIITPYFKSQYHNINLAMYSSSVWSSLLLKVLLSFLFIQTSQSPPTL